MSIKNTSIATSSEMLSRRPPAFQCYASDYIAQEEYVLASFAERGLLFTLLNHCWVNDSVPADIAKLSRLLGVDASELESTIGDLVKKYLKADPVSTDRFCAPELVRQLRDMRARSSRLSESGRKGGKSTQDRIECLRQPSSDDSSLAKAPEMSRDELSGVEKKRIVSETGDLTDNDKWIKDFDG